MTNREQEETMKTTRCIHLLIAVIALGLIGSGCTASSGTAPVQVQNTPQATPTVTATLPPQSTPTPTIPFHVDLSCWPIKPLQKEQDIKGSLIFGSTSQSPFIWDVSSFRAKDMNTTWEILASPHGDMIGYLPWGKLALELISPNGTLSFQLPEGDYGGISSYLPDGKIRIGTGKNDIMDNYKKGVGATDRFYVFDPATGKMTFHSVFLPGLIPLPRVVEIQYSPDLHYVIYRTYPNSDGQPIFNLLNLSNNKVVWSGPEVGADMRNDLLGTVPSWMPDSSGLVYNWEKGNDGENFYFISLDGKVTQFTQFKGIKLTGVNAMNLPLPSWSSDGRFMAFRVTNSSYPNESRPHLYIWDNKEKVAYKPCWPEEAGDYNLDDNLVTWSFDGAHLFVHLDYWIMTPTSSPSRKEVPPTTSIRSTDMILDLSNKTIYELPDKNNRGDYMALYKNKPVEMMGWLNWEIP
jgi:hypothetical protein